MRRDAKPGCAWIRKTLRWPRLSPPATQHNPSSIHVPATKDGPAHAAGALVYVEQDGTAIGYDDVFTRLEGTRRHYASAGVDQGYLETLIR